MAKIKLILCDFGNVIGHFDIKHFNKFIQINGGQDSKISQYFNKHKPAFDKNKIGEKDFWTNLAKVTKVNLPINKIIENQQKNLMIDYRMVELIKKIKTKKVLWSTMDKTTVKQIKKELDINKIFNKTIFSCEINKSKKDESVLKKVCKEFNVKPNETLIIDDYKPALEKVKKMGFQTYQFKNYALFSKDIKKFLQS